MLGGDVPEDGRRDLTQYGELRRDVIATERAALLDLRSKGSSPLDVLRRIERDLDLDESRIRG